MFDFHERNLGGEYDEVRTQRYINRLMDVFYESAEAQSLRDRQSWVQTMLEYGFNYVGVSPANMTRRDFEEVLFKLFPRKVSVEADQAEIIIVGLRAFWAFAARQYAAANAPTMLAVLDHNAVNRLRSELSNPANFGMAKTFFMEGSQQGFDMTTAEGLEAFTTAYNANLQTGPKESLPKESLPMRQPTEDSLKKKRKEKRKQRQAKKQNRPR